MVLFIDACLRENSRTRKLAEAYLTALDSDYERLDLYEANIPPLNVSTLEVRDLANECNNYDDNYFSYAKQFAAAETIVIAAPFWDLSFPSVLKKYIENICIAGLTFKYSEEGVPVGLCNAKKLVYITTAGGIIYDDAFGYGYIKSLARNLFGIAECEMIKAENLDIVGNNPDLIINEKIGSFKKQ